MNMTKTISKVSSNNDESDNINNDNIDNHNINGNKVDGMTVVITILMTDNACTPA